MLPRICHPMQQKPCHWRPRENPNPELVVNRPRTVRIDLLSNTVPNIRHLVRKHAYRRRTVQTAVGPGFWGHFLFHAFLCRTWWTTCKKPPRSKPKFPLSMSKGRLGEPIGPKRFRE